MVLEAESRLCAWILQSGVRQLERVEEREMYYTVTKAERGNEDRTYKPGLLIRSYTEVLAYLRQPKPFGESRCSCQKTVLYIS